MGDGSFYTGSGVEAASAPASAAAVAYTIPSVTAAAPAANPYGQQAQITPEVIYWGMGYMGEPTLVDIIADLVASQNDTARFFSEQKGLLAFAEVMGILLDVKLSNFFEHFRINFMEDDDGMFLKPAAEQSSTEGQRLKQLQNTAVATTIQNIGDQMVQGILSTGEQQFSNERIAKHRQAANLAAQQTGLASLLDEFTGPDDPMKPGIIPTVINTGLRAVGVPVAPLVPSYPPPPPGVR
jgi:hypothetical protein